MNCIGLHSDVTLLIVTGNRGENVKFCVEITLGALKKFKEKGVFESYSQKKIGRYYSFMPSPLKEICLNNYNRYAKSL